MSQDCPAELTQSKSLTTEDGNILTFKYAVVLSSFSENLNMLCAHLESDTEGYIGFGISPTGTMSGGEAIIGMPADADDNPGTVMKYNLSGDSPRTLLMPDENQTLMYTNITQADGNTVMTFAKILKEVGELEILASGENTFLYALGGQGSGLSYHGTNRGDFTLDFDTTRSPTSSSSTLAPTYGGVVVSPGQERTITPTAAFIDRDEPRPTPAPIPPAPTPDTPTPDAPTPDAPSGAMIRKKIGTMILGAGAVAVWFGM